MAQCIISILVISVLATLVASKDYYIRTDASKGECTYTGYIPGGKKVNIEPITAPTAKLEGGILSKIAGVGARGTALAMHSVNALKAFEKVSKTFMALAPKLASSLGVFGAALGMITEFTKPSAQDIINACNKAINKLTEEVNARFTDMKDYVAQEILKSVIERVDVEYKHMFTMWSQCIDEHSTERIIECQEDSARYIRSGYGKFLLFKDDFAMKKIPTGSEVKKMELTFLPFREYVILDVMQIQTLADTYSDASLKDAAIIRRKYLTQLSTDIKMFIDYANNMYKAILDAHTTRALALCKSTKKCSSKCIKEYGSWWINICYCNCKCLFDPTILATKECMRKVTVRADGKKVYPKQSLPVNLGYGPVGEYFAWEKLLKPSQEKYATAMATDVENYWKGEILNLIPILQEIKDKADKERLLKADTMLDLIPQQDAFSDRFADRYNRANQYLNSHKDIYQMKK